VIVESLITEQTEISRFMERVECTDSCWWWRGPILNSGYGSYGGSSDKGPRSAHRKAYTLFRGPIPTGKDVCHTCDNRLCVNPDHLWIGTMKDKIHDMMKKGRLVPRRPVYGPPTCHPDRPHGSAGKCDACYKREWRKRRKLPKPAPVTKIGSGMTVAIIGSADYFDPRSVDTFVDSLFVDNTVLSAGTSHFDRYVAQSVQVRALLLRVIRGDQERHRTRAGYFRDREIVKTADAVAVFWDGASPNTKHAMTFAKTLGKLVYLEVAKPAQDAA
jgi:HNH endonuclease